MDQTLANRTASYQHSNPDSPFQFFLGSHSILSTHRVHGATIEWYHGSVLQWFHGSGVIVLREIYLPSLCQALITW